MPRGRPPNLEAWVGILTRLRKESLKEIASQGPYSVVRLRHYVREFVARGLIEPATAFSHLPTDGPGAKRYVLTIRGTDLLRDLVAEMEGPRKGRGITANSVESSARATIASAPRYSQRYVGAHNLCFRMVIEQPFERPMKWASEHAMGPKDAPRWMSRHATYEAGVHVEEAGGTISDPAGAAGHVIMLKFAVDAKGRSTGRRGERGRIPCDGDSPYLGDALRLPTERAGNQGPAKAFVPA